MLLDVLEIEFKESNCQEGYVVLEKFIGREKQNFEFVTECSASTSQMIRLKSCLVSDISANVTSRKLTDIVQEHYSQCDEREMRCECPGSDYKRLTTTLSQSSHFWGFA